MSRPEDDALDRLESVAESLDAERLVGSASDVREAAVTVREALERQREERDEAEDDSRVVRQERLMYFEKFQAAEAEVRRWQEKFNDKCNELVEAVFEKIEAQNEVRRLTEGLRRDQWFHVRQERERTKAAEAELERIRQALIDTTEDVLASVGEWVAGAPEPNKEVLDAIDRRMGQNRALLDASPSDGGGA